MNAISPAAEADTVDHGAADSTNPASAPTPASLPEAGTAATSTEASAATPSVTPAAAPIEKPADAVGGAETARPAAAPSPRALLKQLQEQFPTFRDCLPLAIGIDKQLIAALPSINRKAMRAALSIHTGSMRYLRAMEKAKVRYNLDGTPGAEVNDTHRAHARETLQERFKKEAERKKAERQAAREAAAAEEAARVRQEKLQQLANKFSRNG
jgi:ProP effector